MENKNFSAVFSLDIKKVLGKMAKKDKPGLRKVEDQVYKILSNPLTGKPLQNVMKNYRRVHIGPFVLVYKIENEKITFSDFDHHDKIYKKYKL